MRYRCILVNPNWQDTSLKGITSLLKNKEALGIQYLTASLRSSDIYCDILNAHELSLSGEDVYEHIINNGYNFVGVSCLCQRSYPSSKNIINILNERDYKGVVCLGGAFASIVFKEIMNDIPSLEYILIGEGEYSLVEFIKKLEQREYYQQFDRREYFKDIKGLVYRCDDTFLYSEPERIKDLDKLPFPIRKEPVGEFDSYGEGKNRMFRILAGRGCYGRCSICSVVQYYKPKIYRSPTNLLQEIKYLIDEFKINSLCFNDEIFYDSSKIGIEWVNEFINLLQKAKIKIEFDILMRSNDIREDIFVKLKGIGLKRVGIGIESGVERILKEMKKDITIEINNRALGILKIIGVRPIISFITIIPTMTFDELKQNYRYLFSTKCYIENNLYNKLNIYYGIHYEQILEKEGLLVRANNFYERHNYIFRDNKVGLFSELIDIARKEFFHAIDKLDIEKAHESLNKNDNYIYLNFLNNRIAFWTNLTKYLLLKVDKEDINTEDFSMFLKYKIKEFLKGHCIIF